MNNTEHLLDHYYMKQAEPTRGCLQALKDIILRLDHNISHQRKFQIPFFYYKDKKLCFLWVNKKKLMLGFVEDKNIYPKKEAIKRKDQITSIYIDPNADIPVELINTNLLKTIKLYNGL